MKSVLSTMLALCSLLFFITPAIAQETPEEPPAVETTEPPPAAAPSPAAQAQAPCSGLNTVAVTISPIHLTMPFYELTGEYRLASQMSAALLAGAGTIDDLSLWEIGAQFRYYVLGDFDHGMQVGAEVLHMGVSASGSEDDIDVSASGAGTSFGGFIGYKFAASYGLTVDIQAGYQYMQLSAEAEASDGDISVSTEESESEGGALINLNLGWSF